jgi:hypothetical protein
MASKRENLENWRRIRDYIREKNKTGNHQTSAFRAFKGWNPRGCAEAIIANVVAVAARCSTVQSRARDGDDGQNKLVVNRRGSQVVERGLACPPG